MGSLMPLGVGHKLLGTDAAWLWQPYLCFLASNGIHYQLALVTPGSLPLEASSRKQMRQTPNLRI